MTAPPEILLKNLSFCFIYWPEFYGKVEQYLKISDWYVWAHMEKGQVTMPIFQSLDAYWPGLQVKDSRMCYSVISSFYEVFNLKGPGHEIF